MRKFSPVYELYINGTCHHVVSKVVTWHLNNCWDDKKCRLGEIKTFTDGDYDKLIEDNVRDYPHCF